VSGIDAALRDDAPLLHERAPGNVLIAGRQVTGDAEAALAACAHVAEGAFETGFVEHAYIEPEAGWAVRRGDRIEIFVTTQTPYMDRDEIAWILGIAPDRVRIVPSAVGGGFGGKIDMSVQPLIAVAAWVLGHPVRCVYTRPESMASTTKRHPARMHARLGCDEAGRLRAISFHADFNTGPYASCGPIVANRVPIHAMGPYRVPAVRCTTRAIYTTDAIGGAFRGFGGPQGMLVMEEIIDRIAFCIADDEDLTSMNCIKFAPVEGDDVEVCGLNGHQFGFHRFTNPDIRAVLGQEGFLVSKKYLLEIRKWLASDEIEISLSDKRLFLRTGNRKEAFSLAAYVLALPLAFLTPWASVAVYRGLALAWIVSDKRIEAPLKD